MANRSAEYRVLRVHAALFSVAALFSLNYIISKFGMRAFAPLSFAWLRVLGSAAILVAIPVKREPLPNRKVALLALLGVVMNQALFLAGLALSSAHVAAILITTIPLFTLAITMATGRERVTGAKIGGIALAALGALVIVWGEGLRGSTRELLGALMIVGNSLAYSFYLVLSKPLMAIYPARLVLTRMFVFATLLMLPVSAWSLAHESWRTIPAGAWLSLLAVIVGPTVAAYLLNLWTLRHTDSSMAAAYIYVQPPVTALLAWLFLGEQIRAIAIVAAVLIATGMWLSQRKPELSK
ncbi:MAG TPA: DMT family transporter [Thermoanaerobaculia bacterium]|nr:DMT family transporter [Thermoanaerobaculia bacterium]